MFDYEYLESSVRNTLGSVVWSHKIQEKQADIYTARFRSMETAKILASALTSAGLVSLFITDTLWVKILSSLISFVSFFVSAFFKSFNLNDMIGEHKRSAVALLAIRDKLIMLILQIRMKQKTAVELYSEYELLMNQLHKAYSESPNTTDAAVKKAKLALNVTLDNTFSDEEIDSYLPKELRKADDPH